MANAENLGSVGHQEGERVTLSSVRLGGKDLYVSKPQPAEASGAPKRIDYRSLFKIYETSSQEEAEVAWRALFPDVSESLPEIRRAIVPEVKSNPERAIAFAERDWYDIHKPIPPNIAEKGDSPLKYPLALSHNIDAGIEAVIHQELPAEYVGFVLARNKDPLYKKQILLHQKHLGDEGLQRALAFRDSLRQGVGITSEAISQAELAINV